MLLFMFYKNEVFVSYRSKFKTYPSVIFSQNLNNGNIKVFAHSNGTNLRISGAEAKAFLTQARGNGIPIRELGDEHLVLDRGLDLQSHLRFPGQSDRETLEGGLTSAFEGGYDSVIAMPNTKPFLDNAQVLKETLEQIRQHNFKEVKVGQTAAATLDMKGLVATNISALKEAGAVAITDDGWGVEKTEIQEKVFKLCAQENLLFMQHAERPGHGGVTPQSKFQLDNELPIYPEDAESWMVKRDVDLLKKIPEARYHVLHVTTAQSVEIIAQAKRDGLNITAEVSPHHLFCSNEDIPATAISFSTNYKMNPPLFSARHRESLRQALREGIIDCVATDHAPHSPSDKAKGWLNAPFGTRGLETALSVLCTLCHQGVLSYDKLETYFSTRPREIISSKEFSQPNGFVIIDKTKEWVVAEKDLPGISRNSLFLEQKLMGKIIGVVTSQQAFLID